MVCRAAISGVAVPPLPFCAWSHIFFRVVIGVTAGVATLVIALAMDTGFRETLQERLLGVTAHISLTRPGSGGIRDYETLVANLAKTSGVRSVTPCGVSDGASIFRRRSARSGDEGHRPGT